MTDKIEIVALSKTDSMTPDAIKKQLARLKKASKTTPMLLSSASGQGVVDVLRALFKVIAASGGGTAVKSKEKVTAWQP